MANRLDIELVERGLYDSRAKAAENIKNGNVLVDGKVVTKPSALVCDFAKIDAKKEEYVSRAAKKLKHAICQFNISVFQKIAVDVGASTGGFTQVLIQEGAKKVFAIDVGTNQLSPLLASNERVVNMQKTNFLDADPNLLKKAEIVVSDLSFVSLTKMAKKFALVDCPIIVLIKPQFECGKDYAHKHKGIVKDKIVQKQCIENVVKSFKNEGLNLLALDVSPILGGDGNKEFVALFQKNIEGNLIDIEKIVEKRPTLE